jgi:glycosyltransferase involved in cell wall biosynthesis
MAPEVFAFLAFMNEPKPKNIAQMKVLLVNGNWFPQKGGGIVHVRELAIRLVSDFDCKVDIITKSTDVSSIDGYNKLPSDVNLIQIAGTNTRVRPLNEFVFTIGILKRVISHEYQIVHAHTNSATIPLQIINLLPRSRTIFTVHGADLKFSVTFTGTVLDPVFTFIRRIILRHFHYDAIISVSEELANVLEQYHDSVEFIPNGIDVEAFPKPREEFSEHVLFVSRFRPKKNPLDLLEAIQRVRRNHPGVHLHMVGDGPLKSKIKSRIEELDIENNVTIHGTVSEEELKELYGLCTIFVLPSEWEGHPIVLLEAWASGLYVIGTEVEGIREFLGGVDHGRLVPVGDPPALAGAISGAFSSPEETHQQAVSSREFVADHFTWRQTTKRTYELYNKLVNHQTSKEKL